MIQRPICLLLLMMLGSPLLVHAQTQVLSSTPPVVEYQYQMYYPRLWQNWPGPGLSIGGSLPVNTREGISSFYGAPFPVPLGAGVYMNPFAYSSRLPGVPGAPVNIGLSASTTPLPTDPRRVDQSIVPTSQSGPVGPANQIGSSTAVPQRPPMLVSSPESIERSRQMESFGDEKMKLQNWVQAAVNYRNASLVANDRASVHLRLAFASAALKRFPDATAAFKRALVLDPTIGTYGDSMSVVFGPDSQAVRTAIVNDVARWAREDFRNQDRLFLLGAMLHYNEDRRSHDVLEAALKVTGSGEHIVALMSKTPIQLLPPELQPRPKLPDDPTPEPPEAKSTPVLNPQPVALLGM